MSAHSLHGLPFTLTGRGRNPKTKRHSADQTIKSEQRFLESQPYKVRRISVTAAETASQDPWK